MSAFFEALIWFLMDVVYLCGMCYGVVHLSGSREIGTLVGVSRHQSCQKIILFSHIGQLDGTILYAVVPRY